LDPIQFNKDILRQALSGRHKLRGQPSGGFCCCKRGGGGGGGGKFKKYNANSSGQTFEGQQYVSSDTREFGVRKRDELLRLS
jgi:hypothetical protein